MGHFPASCNAAFPWAHLEATNWINRHVPTSHHRITLGHICRWGIQVHPFQNTLNPWHMSLVFYFHSAPLPLWDYSGSTEGTFSEVLTNTECGKLCKAEKNELKRVNNMYCPYCAWAAKCMLAWLPWCLAFFKTSGWGTNSLIWAKQLSRQNTAPLGKVHHCVQ